MDLISPLSPDSLSLTAIKAKLKDFLIANNVITDIDYEGSNISILTQILSYLVANVNSTHAMNANQTNLLLSTVRQNIIHSAQTIGYNITRKISSKINITLTINPLTPNVTIPAWTKFTCGDYNFYNQNDLNFSPSALSITTDLVEGTYIDYTQDATLRFTATEQLSSITLNYKNIEDSNVYYRKKGSSDLTFSNYYTKVESLIDILTNKSNFFEEFDPETQFVKLWVYFSGQGNIIDIGDTVDISFLVSSGSVANGITTCAMAEPDTAITIAVNSASRGGTDEETNESIQNNAPLFYNTGLRTVTDGDYKAFLIKNSLVGKAESWGGELILPKKLGHTFLSIIPQDTTAKYLTTLEEADILAYLNEKPMIATGRIFKNPNYLSFDFTITLLGDIVNSAASQSVITAALTDYFNTNHNDFNTYLFENKIIRLIESVFDTSENASLKVAIQPKLRLSKELFTQTFDNGRWDIWIPNSNKKYYLVNGTSKIPLPANEADIYSYLLNGWTKTILPEEDITVSFSGTINSKTITYDTTIGTVTIDSVTYNKQDVLLDGAVIGYFIPDLNILSLTDITSDLAVDGFINIDYSPELNIKSEKSTVMELGNITYV